MAVYCYISTKVQDLSVGRGMDTRSEGGVPVILAKVGVRAGGPARPAPGGGGHGNQTPSPQAAISINHDHNARSSIECAMLVEKA